jgi:hypothetical protein
MGNPPDNVSLPPNTVVTRVFGLEVMSYDAGSNSARARTDEEKEAASPVVLTTGLTPTEFSALPALPDGGRDTSAFSLLRVKPDGSTELIPITWVPDPAPNGSIVAVFQARSLYLLAVLPSAARSVPADNRYFPQTGYRVNLDNFWIYFQRRGGVRAFGYPVSREFILQGFTVQLFQRGMLQLMADGSVATMNLLDGGMMGFSRINGSTFPAAERQLLDGAPSPNDPDFGEKAIEFLKANIPDQWDGHQVNFLQSYLSTVRFEDAYPRGNGERALVPLLNLELWGLPTSRPAYDPANHNFVYQRFQRGILHYDATSGTTQGLLLGDYLKGIMTGRNLPADLERQAIGSSFYRQYDRSRTVMLARRTELPGSNLRDAFEPEVAR